MKEAKIDDLISVDEMSVWSDFDKEKRANSIHVFKPSREEKKFAKINWGEKIDLTSQRCMSRLRKQQVNGAQIDPEKDEQANDKAWLLAHKAE